MRQNLEMIVVEDDPLYQAIYVDMLEGTGCHISLCNSVSLAANLSALIRPDVILLDLGLPDGDGVQAIIEVKKNLPDEMPHVIVVTGSSDSDEHKRALAAGADAIMVKPVAAQDLRQKLEALVATRTAVL